MFFGSVYFLYLIIDLLMTILMTISPMLVLLMQGIDKCILQYCAPSERGLWLTLHCLNCMGVDTRWNMQTVETWSYPGEGQVFNARCTQDDVLH